jgi:hypothetical protein
MPDNEFKLDLGDDVAKGLAALGGDNSPNTDPPVVVTDPLIVAPVTNTDPPPTGDNNEEGEYFESETGDIVDAKGTVIVPKDKIQRDEEGNVILPEEADTAEVERIRKALELELGVNFVDEKGNAIAFPNTDEGVVNMVKTAAEHMQQQFEADFFGEYPIAADLVRHIRAGKAVDTFFNVPTQWRKTVIPVDSDKTKESNKLLRKDVLLQKEVISRAGGSLEHLSKAQLEAIKAEAAEYVEYLVSTGTEVEKAQSALKYLQDWENQQETSRDAENRAILQEKQKTAQKFWGDVKTTVESGNLGVAGIPKTEREAFFNYLAAPVDKAGNTQEMLDLEKEDIKNRLFLSYLRFKKFNVDDVLKTKLLTQKAEELKGRGHKVVKVKFGAQDIPGKPLDIGNINLDKILG